VALFFAALAPTLSWPQFSNDGEDLLVQTVLEMRHGGPWWVPTLGGHPRTRKPPLPAWITAAAISPNTVRDLSSTSPSVRAKAYQNFAFEVRLPALFAACMMLLAVGWLASLVGGPSHVFPAIIVCATSILFIRQIRLATTDVYLALFITLANCFFALALLGGRKWLGFCGAGLFLGLAIMCKGPVALAVSAAPALAFELRRKVFRTTHPSNSPGRWVIPVAIGGILMLAVSLPWPMSVLIRNPKNLQVWAKELQRERGANVSHDPWYAYISLLPNLLPWTPLFLAGIFAAARRLRPERRIFFALTYLVVPIIIMSLFHDRKDRYLLPLAGITSILTAHAIVRIRRAAPPSSPSARWLLLTHWITIGIISIGLPLAGAWALLRADGQPWFSPVLSVAAVFFAIVILAIGLYQQPRRTNSFVLTGALLTLSSVALFLFGWSKSISGLSEMKPVADRILALGTPNKIVYFDPPPSYKPVTLDLDIYLDRVVPVMVSPPTAAPYNDADLVVMLWNDEAPEPAFPGWKKLFDMVSRKHHWYVLTRGG
jgi:4-amino-4-deoxy-L-arabinose transferase-like glycosyltransferase